MTCEPKSTDTMTTYEALKLAAGALMIQALGLLERARLLREQAQIEGHEVGPEAAQCEATAQRYLEAEKILHPAALDQQSQAGISEVNL